MDNSEQREEAFAEDMLRYWLEAYVAAEITRRRETGELGDDFVLSSAQIVMRPGHPVAVRLNREVSLIALVKVRRAVAAGEAIYEEDIEGPIGEHRLAPEDEGADHITMFLRSDGWHVVFQFDSRNEEAQLQHLEAGQEFLAVAEAALSEGRLRAFVENAWSATELFAEADLLTLGDPDLVTVRKHKFRLHAYRIWANLGNTEKRFSDLLHEFDRLRRSARYPGEATFSLTEVHAGELLAVLRDLNDHVAAVCPGGDRANRKIYLQARRSIRAGELVGGDDVSIRRMHYPHPVEELVPPP